MTPSEAQRVLCAVRGQPGSRSTADRAAALAIELDAQLTYLLVIEAQFLSRAGPSLPPLRIVYEQLEAMGDFAMTILAERALRRGVPSVDYIIRKGKVPQEIRAVIDELQPGVLVMGRPVEPIQQARFNIEELDRFIQQLADETDLRIEVEETSDVDNLRRSNGGSP